MLAQYIWKLWPKDFFFLDCEDRLAQGKLDKHLGEFERAGEPLKKEPNCWT